MLLLAIDWVRFPVFFDTSGFEPVVIETLLRDKVVTAGQIKGQQVRLALDDVEAADAFNYARQSRNALVISHFLDQTSMTGYESPLGRAIRSRLVDIAPKEAGRLLDHLAQLRSRSPGSIISMELNPPPGSSFPVQEIEIALLKYGDLRQNLDSLAKAVENLMSRMQDTSASGLLLSTLSHDYRDETNSLSFDQIFQIYYDALNKGSRPITIYFLLYNNWPTAVLEDAIRAVNVQHARLQRTVSQQWAAPHRGDYRLILLLLPVCFVTSFRRTKATIRNYLVIGSGFIGLALGSRTTVDFIAKPETTHHLLLQLTVWMFLALMFPLLKQWTSEHVFEPSKAARERRKRTGRGN